MRLVNAILAAIIVFWLSACDRWPPQSVELRELFLENRSSFEALEEKILATHYENVAIVGIEGTDNVKLMWEMATPDEGGAIYDWEIVADSEWWSLLRRTQVFSVNQADGVVWFDFGRSLDLDGTTINARYVHSSADLKLRKPCNPKFKSIPCGHCAIEISDGWFIDYWWSPEDLLPVESARMVDGDLTMQEYDAMYDIELLKCRKNGFEEIGYDLSLWES